MGRARGLPLAARRPRRTAAAAAGAAVCGLAAGAVCSLAPQMALVARPATWRGLFAASSRHYGKLSAPLRAVNEAGFDVGVKIDPEEAARMGLQPFGDGGADNNTSPRPKVYSHGPCASNVAQEFVVPCEGWSTAGEEQQQALAERAFQALRMNGFVILEKLMPREYVAPLEKEAAQYLDAQHEGFIPQPLRANRSQLHLPYSMPWASEWLVQNDLILELVARYVKNDLAGGRTQEEQQWGLVQWLTSGADLDWFLGEEWGPKPGKLWDSPPQGCSAVGRPDERGPWLGRVMVTKTPPGAPPQKFHRDINFPGPTAQLTVQVGLTQLLANNGPLGYVPGTHRMITPGFQVVANPPLGSVVLYDSFVEHHGIENHGATDRYAMYYEFETRGIFGGYTDDHFGDGAASHTEAFRKAVDPALRRWVQRVAR